MKHVKFITLLVSILFSINTDANGSLENVGCYSKSDVACQVVLNKSNELSQVDYDVNLIDSNSGKEVFPNLEKNSTMEWISLYKSGDRYVFLKEYLDSTKAMEFFTFKYRGNKPQDIKYYYIESSIDFDRRLKKWSGKQCEFKNNYLPNSEDKTLLATLSSMCVNDLKLSYTNNTYINNDVIFNVSRVLDGNVKNNMTLIALDSKNQDGININDLACSTNCDPITNSANYIGKLNGKIRIKLHLDFDDNMITGYYYYDAIKENIKITGVRDGANLALIAHIQGRKEFFNGVINDGKFTGTWKGINREYPFSLYLMLTH
ncbi:hypothetical protein [Yersinia mollaretii]|uniref:Uncharacterized protein n=1 Tax=Yersinia mollaretii TaxID=33060 RepID=A0AA36LL13_YERMO|nr:hypothetical protein [Yersinia mollaretii]MDA5525623.1 hypothetical protein [Yersinia mollaretii]MDR7871724.1 hypothetical protein [Yersinia mollaretii]PHZ29904.1 hypothetical protein CS537_20280 [Yersinia mollaretii]WQC73726.1 hypothetical protein U1Z61_14905 [Yersinia mollaretii]CNE05869.1 Uncharacterised protein [Yersinia mollaretii]